MRLLLVRHGETAWNAEHRLQGQEDIPLSPEGQRQATGLGALVRTYRPSVVVSSPLRRAAETARLMGFDRPETDERWREASLGTWTGRTADDLRADGSDDYRRWRAGALTPPGAESFTQLADRVTDAVDGLRAGARGAPDVVLVITHGGPIRAVCDRFLGLAPEAVVPAEPASLTILDFADRARLRTYSLAMSVVDRDPPD
jgi:broad specificity phosphatase PhoE